MASREESAARDAGYACCTFRGSLTALNLSDGSVAWRYFTVDAQQQTSPATDPSSKSSLGESGAAVWSTPAIDPDAKLIYVTTGNSYTTPVSPNSDAIVAVNLDDGTQHWSTQLTPADVWNFGCDQKPKTNCDTEPGKDFDFSSSAMLVTTGEMKLVIGIQKNGNINALDALTGKPVWKQSIGIPTAINWGSTFDGKRIYTGDASFNRNGAVYALNPTNGNFIWEWGMPSCQQGPKVPAHRCWSGNMNAASSSPGLVWVATIDGQIHAFDAESGKALWSYNTAQDARSTNGVPGHGGSIGAAGVTIANGQVYVTSGYSLFTDSFMEGNVLFAFGLQTSEEF